jgi:hypothetical protein
MALPSAIGATIKNLNTLLTTNLTTSTWEFVAPVTIDASNNTNLTTDNDGSITNDTGEELEFEGQIIIYQIMSTARNVLLSIGLYDGVSWTPVDEDLNDVVYDTSQQYFITINYKINVPVGYKVGLLAKSLVGTTAYQTYYYVHFSRSLDGGENPALAIACSTVSSTYYSLNTNGTGTWLAARPTTTEYSGAIGAISNTNRITNDSGETVTVDGWIFAVEYFNGGVAVSFQTTAYKNGVAIPDTISTSLSLSSSSSFRAVIIYYTVELADGDYVDLMQKNTGGGTYALWNYSIQHIMRSRT